MGKVQVVELDWTAEDKLRHVRSPFDFVIAADCIYHENHMEDLLDTILKLTDDKSTGTYTTQPTLLISHRLVLVVNELRSTSIDAEFHRTFGSVFNMKKLPSSSMDPLFRHPDIHIFVLKKKRTLPSPKAIKP